MYFNTGQRSIYINVSMCQTKYFLLQSSFTFYAHAIFSTRPPPSSEDMLRLGSGFEIFLKFLDESEIQNVFLEVFF